MSSRQRDWQRAKQQEGRCMICGDGAVVSGYCERHKQQRLDRLRGEDYTPQTCGVCGKEGHNKRTCPDRDPDSDRDEEAGATA